MRLIIIESDSDLREFLTEMFVSGSHQVHAYRSLESLRLTDLEQADLVILEWDHDPEGVTRFLKGRGSPSKEVPVIMICTDPPEDRTVRGLCMDVCEKPHLSILTQLAQGT